MSYEELVAFCPSGVYGTGTVGGTNELGIQLSFRKAAMDGVVVIYVSGDVD
jgi:hypothetical protein